MDEKVAQKIPLIVGSVCDLLQMGEVVDIEITGAPTASATLRITLTRDGRDWGRVRLSRTQILAFGPREIVNLAVGLAKAVRGELLGPIEGERFEFPWPLEVFSTPPEDVTPSTPAGS